MRTLHRTLAALAVVTTVALAPDRATAQATKPEPTNFSTWMRTEIQKILTDERAIAANGNGVANQNESPSTDITSTSLVDTSSASDFVSLALNLTGLRAEEDEEDSTPTSGSVTATLYSLIAGIKGVSLTDPQFYKRGTPWRRLSLTIGSEESTLEDHFTDKPSTNLGAKLLILNNRDVYSAHAQKQLAAIDVGVDAFVADKVEAINAIQCLAFYAVEKSADPKVPCLKDPAFGPFLATSPFNADNWPKTLAALQKDKTRMEEVHTILRSVATSHRTASEIVNAAVEQVQKGLQLSVAYFTKQREDDGTDEHRTELIFDYGLSTRLNWTANASFDYSDRKQAADRKSGRFATEFQAKLSNPGSRLWSARPVTLSGSVQGSKASESDWLIRAQAKVVVPVTTGVDIPIAYSYANRDDEGIVSGSQLKFSLAVDPVRLRERFR